MVDKGVQCTPLSNENEDDIIKGATNDQPYNPAEQSMDTSFEDDTMDVDKFEYHLTCTYNLHNNLLNG